MKNFKDAGINIEDVSLCLGSVLDTFEQQFNVMHNDEVIGCGHINTYSNWAHVNLTLNADFNRNLNVEAELEYELEIMIENNKINTYNA